MQKSEPMEAQDTGGREKIEKDDSLPSTAISLQFALKVKDTEGQEKTEKEDSPALSVHESVQTMQAIKEKKRNWLFHLFT